MPDAWSAPDAVEGEREQPQQREQEASTIGHRKVIRAAACHVFIGPHDGTTFTRRSQTVPNTSGYLLWRSRPWGRRKVEPIGPFRGNIMPKNPSPLSSSPWVESSFFGLNFRKRDRGCMVEEGASCSGNSCGPMAPVRTAV